MTMTRDFLVHDTPEPDNQHLVSILDKQNRRLAEIALNLRKRVPNVLTTTVVQGSNNGQINDTNSHMIWFEIGGKPVQIHKLLFFGFDSGTGNIKLSLDSGDTGRQGWVFPLDNANTKAFVTELDISITNLYIYGIAGAQPYYVNTFPIPPVSREVWLWGFTTESVDWTVEDMLARI